MRSSTQLKKRVNAELEAYISEMKSRPFDEIIEAAYRVTTCKKINDYVSNEKLDLTDEQLSAFLSMDNILDEIYLEWVKNDSAETYDDVLMVMQDRADRIVLSQQRENVPVEHFAPEAEKKAPTAESPAPEAPKDKIAEALNLSEYNLTFSVVTINNELTFAVGEYIEKDDIHGLEEYQDYIAKNQLDETRVYVEYCMIGNVDAESEMAYTDDIDFINKNLKAVMNHPLTTNLEINNYLIATPDEMLESRQQEKELAEAKKYIDEYLYDMFRFDGDNFEDMEHIEAGYTELGENGEYRLQMEIDLVNLKIRYSLENEVVKTDSYNSLAEMNELALSNLDFNEFVAVGNDALDEYE